MADSEPAKSGALLTVPPSVPDGHDAQVTGSAVGPLPLTDLEGPKLAEPIESIEAAQGVTARRGWRLYAILGSLFLSLFVAALDQTIVATCIPTIAASLHSAQGYVWIGGAYLLATAAAGPIWARCSDIWGRKPVLLAAIVLFATASVIAATSISMPMMIAARALQGVAGGGVSPLVTITISDLFSVRRRSLFMSLLAMVWAVAGSAGPLVGGAFTQLASWRWCFWINLPICSVSFLLVLLFLDVHNPRTKLADGLRAIDWLGTVAMLAVTLMVLLGLDFGGATFPWSSPKVICLLAVGGAMVGAFLYSEAKFAKYPLMPLGLFGHWHNNAICIISFAHHMVAIGCEFYLPLYFQSAKKAMPFQSGLMLLPLMAAEAGIDIVSGLLIHYTGRYREIMWVGTALMTLGTGLYLLFTPDTPVRTIIGCEIVAGIGSALLYQSPMLAVQNTVAQSETATATATMGFLGNVATALSVVLGGVILQNSMDKEQPSLVAAGLNSTTLAAFTGSQAAANVDLVASITDAAQKYAVEVAFAASLRNIFKMYAAIAGVAFIASVLVQQRRLQTEHTETKTGLDNLKQRDGE